MGMQLLIVLEKPAPNIYWPVHFVLLKCLSIIAVLRISSIWCSFTVSLDKIFVISHCDLIFQKFLIVYSHQVAKYLIQQGFPDSA